jgi:hypothetical protein
VFNDLRWLKDINLMKRLLLDTTDSVFAVASPIDSIRRVRTEEPGVSTLCMGG